MCVKGTAAVGGWLWCGVWLWVQELCQHTQPEGEKLSLLILMDVLHNLFTTVEETITLRPCLA